MKSSGRIRAGVSLIEVILGLTISVMLLVPMVGMLQASARIWRQFEGGHGAVANRQSAALEVGNRLRAATRILNLGNSRVRFQVGAGDIQTIYLQRNQILWQHAGRTDVLINGVGGLQMRQLDRGATAAQGELVEIVAQNPANSGVANTRSALVVWVKPSI